MRVALDQRAERHHEVDVLVTVDIPDVRAASALKDDGAGRVDGSAARRRVDAFDERLLRSGEVLLRFSALACVGRHVNGNRRSDSCLTPLSSILNTQRDPLQRSHSGDRSTIPEARRSSRLPCSSTSSSNAVTDIPARSNTSLPSASKQVSLCDKQRISPNNPLKSAFSRIALGPAI